ncbi:hypothetical protein [Hymenobacter cheonanensis]|uniref:hypothetical protein n=1 Tax=Hymenobacter sp. CA2-7 TaxID=3063993 RepID=UPI0027123613|nr:hypothetical protein [Hymenobacter sp. CA2-7]MDO7886586.1 hypothetical protein [Hymenobacter sp. CA2-7]
MSIRILLPALLALPLLGAAQNTLLGAPAMNDLSRNNGLFNNGYSLIGPDANKLHGNPFLAPGWTPATIQLQGNATPTPATMRYDVYRQEVRVRRPQGDSVIVPLNRIKEFTLSPAGRRFVCYPAATLPAEVQDACAEVLADGAHLQLLKFWRKKLVKEPAENSSYASNSTMDVLQTTSSYYLRWPADGHLVAVRPKRSSLEQALAGQPAALAALKAQKGGLGSEAELAAAVQALDPTITTGR